MKSKKASEVVLCSPRTAAKKSAKNRPAPTTIAEPMTGLVYRMRAIRVLS